MRVSVVVVVEVVSILLLLAFWVVVWWPGVLPTLAAAGLAWSRSQL